MFRRAPTPRNAEVVGLTKSSVPYRLSADKLGGYLASSVEREQVQMTPNSCGRDPCLAACSGKINGLLYFNPRGQFKFWYQARVSTARAACPTLAKGPS